MPTLLDLAGIDGSGKEPGQCYPEMHGKSLVPAFRKDGSVDHDYIFFEHQGNNALIEGNWKIVSSRLDGGAWELFNLEEDRSEQNDLSEKLPGKLKTMTATWEELSRQYEKQRTGEQW
jgi:arylsulfatase